MPESITAGYPNPIPSGAVKTEQIKDGAVTEPKINLDTTPEREDYSDAPANTRFVNRNRSIIAGVRTYTTIGQPVNTLKITIEGAYTTIGQFIRPGDYLTYYAQTAGEWWWAQVIERITDTTFRIPANWYSAYYMSGNVQLTTMQTAGFTGGNVSGTHYMLITPVRIKDQ